MEYQNMIEEMIEEISSLREDSENASKRYDDAKEKLLQMMQFAGMNKSPPNRKGGYFSIAKRRNLKIDSEIPEQYYTKVPNKEMILKDIDKGYNLNFVDLEVSSHLRYCSGGKT